MHSLAPHEHSYPHLWHMPSTRHQTFPMVQQQLADRPGLLAKLSG
jgi:hypothetical protein